MPVHTRIFRSGNSLAVRIPREMAIATESDMVEIERVGDTLTIRPAQRATLAGIGEIFSAFSADFMTAGREFHEHTDRDWNPPG